MQHSFGQGMLVAWTPIVLALFWRFGPVRAVPLALFGGFLLLPRWPLCGWSVLGTIVLDKRSLTGLAVALGVLLFDRQRLARFRPKRIDLLMLGYVLVPLASAAANGLGTLRGSIAETFVHLTEWGLPYVVTRIYYDDGEGPRRLAWQIVVAALLYLPIIVFEAILGPNWYLCNLLYGIHVYNDDGYARLGGWRPEGMLSNGIELTEWISLAAILALWMWAVARWRTSPIPAWLPPPVLILTAVGCRSVYGYGVLAMGLAVTPLIVLFKTRLPMMALVLVPPVYIAARTSGVWDGQAMIDLAEKAGNRNTTLSRLWGENIVLDRMNGPQLILGLGGRWPDWLPDGQWPSTLEGSGLVGLALMYATMLVPAALIIWRRPPRSTVPTPETGLAFFLVLHAVSSLHNMSLIVAVPMICGLLTGFGRDGFARIKPVPKRGPDTVAEPGHATYRLSDITPTAVERSVDLGPIHVALALACLLYIFGHALVAGQEFAKFVGGLGSTLLFVSVGAAVAGAKRRSLARVAGFGLAFAVLGISFNLALHASNRPIWSADILQGLALCGVVVATWRWGVGRSALTFLVLAGLAACWWAFEPNSRPFWGSQYLFCSRGDGRSLFPVLPWLALSALGAALVNVKPVGCSILAVGFGFAAWVGWDQGLPFGPAVKFPLNPTYVLLGASLGSATFAISGLLRRFRPSRAASDWLGRRWLVFFYIHLGFAVGLGRVGLTQPLLGWAVLGLTALVATWAIQAAANRVRPIFRQPWAWAVLAASMIAVGLVPGLPDVIVLAVAGTVGLLFAALHDELAGLMLGPVLDERGSQPHRVDTDGNVSYLTMLALVVVVLIAPELVGRLPAPFGTGPRTIPKASANDLMPPNLRAPEPRP